jgi:hypothetical protein
VLPKKWKVHFPFMPKTTKKQPAIHAFDGHHCDNMQGSYFNLFQVQR